jgi:NAD(P)-dependent dehydrogenase (short-subunit alcohol dehydrogenase family)
MERLSGRRAVVTGAASGIGLASAIRLAAEGASVTLLDAREGSFDLASFGTDAGRVAGTARCDVGNESDVEAAVAAAADAMGGIDILVSAAGITRGGDTDGTPLEEWEAVIRVNLTGTFLCIKHTVPHLVSSGNAAIVTIGSVASLVAAGRSSSYDASKGGVLQLTRAVAVEYVERGVRANCVCPGMVRTGLAANSVALHGNSLTTSVAPPAERLRVPMSRYADASEIAAVVAFLASDDASFITGAAIAADGGYTAI